MGILEIFYGRPSVTASERGGRYVRISGGERSGSGYGLDAGCDERAGVSIRRWGRSTSYQLFSAGEDSGEDSGVARHRRVSSKAGGLVQCEKGRVGTLLILCLVVAP